MLLNCNPFSPENEQESVPENTQEPVSENELALDLDNFVFDNFNALAPLDKSANFFYNQ